MWCMHEHERETGLVCIKCGVRTIYGESALTYHCNVWEGDRLKVGVSSANVSVLGLVGVTTTSDSHAW